MPHTDLSRVLSAISGRVWALHEPKMAELRAVHARLSAGQRMTEKQARRIFGAARPRQSMRAGQVAVLPLYGVIAPRMNSLSAMSGGTSCEGFAKAFDAAMAHADVSAIIIDGDSPGGDAQGAHELAEKILAARGDKPIIVVANHDLASAAYWVGCSADEVVITPSACTPSIGCYTIHEDVSAMLAREGVSVEVVRSAPNKAEGNPYEPLSDEARAHLQEMVNDVHRRFVAHVAKARGLTPAQVEERFGGGRVLSAQAAKRAGVADRIGTLEDVLSEHGITRQPSARAMAALDADRMPLAALGWSATWEPLRPMGGQGSRPRSVGGLAAGSDPAADLMGMTARDARRFVAGVRALAAATEDVPDVICPECDAPTDADECPECGYEMQAGDDAGEKKTKPGAGGDAAAAQVITPDINAADSAGRETMPDKTQGAAPDTGSAVDINAIVTQAVTAALAAQGAQAAAVPSATGTQPAQNVAAEIRAMAAEQGVDAVHAERWIASGLNTDQVGREILAIRRERTQGAGTITVGEDRAGLRPFVSFGEQLMCIVQAGSPGGGVDPRLLRMNAGPSGAGSQTAADGGFLIQSEFSSEIVKRVYETGEIAKRVRKIPIGAGKNGLKMNAVDEDSRANGSRFGGVTMYWENEADAASATKPKFRKMELELRKLMGAMYATEELLDDATALEAVAEEAFTEEATFKVEDAIYRGPGGGVPLGWKNSGAKIAVAKESGQAAATINTTNVLNMWSRLWARSRGNAVWFINQDVEPSLYPLTLGSGTAVSLLYTPPGMRGNTTGLLMGAPVLATEYADTLGTEGDIMLVDPTQYLLIDKGGVRKDWSIHVRFLYDERVFKIVYRVDGQPIWNKPLTPYKGSSTVSPIITLATRS